jgi:selenocysteine-specific elongation factor
MRVRSVQVHDEAVKRAEPGQRVAVALPGIDRSELRRGDALVTPSAYVSSYRLDVALERLAEIPPRVLVHHGTNAVLARVVAVGERWAQLRLAEPVVAARGDHVVLRAATTVGGGRVIDPAPPRHASAARMELVEQGAIAAIVHEPVRVETVSHLADGEIDGVQTVDGWVFAPAWLDELRAELEAGIGAADQLDPGVPLPAEAWAAAIVPLLGLERRGAKLYLPGATAELGARTEAAEALESQLGLEPVKIDDVSLGRFLEQQGRLVRVGDGYAVSTAAYDDARDALVAECESAGGISLARFRDLLGVGRKTAQLLLERFDADGLTRRVGDERVLRRRGRLSR